MGSHWDDYEQVYYQEPSGDTIDITNGFPSQVLLTKHQRRAKQEYHDEHFATPPLERALNLAEFGYRVLPVVEGTKIPALKGWQKSASDDPHTISNLWIEAEKAHPGRLIQPGVLIDHGFLVVDIDKHTEDSEAWKSFIDHGLTFPLGADTAMSCRTQNDGLHVYLRDDRGARTRNGLYPGIDLKASGFVVAYPNLFPMRREHLAPAPDWCYPPGP